MRTGLFRTFCISALAVLITESSQAQSLDAKIWQDVAAKTINPNESMPETFRALSINTASMATFLSTAPDEHFLSAKASPVTLTLPMPDGSNQRFSIVKSPIMEEGLAARYPSIKTYSGQGIDNPAATLRFDLTPQGFHAMVLSPEGTYFIDPVELGSSTLICYNKEAIPARYDRTCSVTGENINTNSASPENTAKKVSESGSIGLDLNIYRLALAATGEYTKARGGTKEKALASMVTSVNRVVGVYEKETATRLVLINNTDQLIYTDGTTDPYTNTDGGTMLGENQTNVDNVIGSANYDIGHVFSTGGGGIAQLQAVCNASQKARGVTGSPSPTGDSFDIDYVAHEMGHQFGCNHTFNSTAGSCGGGNRANGTAYEPGGGVTIMAYAGICGNDNITAHSIPYFHTKSFDEFTNFAFSGNGNSCPTTSSTGNNPPEANAGSDYVIPISTPFILTGSATDPDGDALTYSWEEFDLGPAGVPNSPSGNAPIFRSFTPRNTPIRICPQIGDITGNRQTKGELLPSYGRSLKFRLTARDNRAGGGGVGYDLMNITVDGNSGPFKVTYPDSSNTFWIGGLQKTITWNVANTTSAPVSCSAVHILLSQDGGLTFTDTLLKNTPNDGSETITVPNYNTTQARIIVASAGNIFFDMSNKNFSITQGTAINDASALPAYSLFPNPAKSTVHISVSQPVTIQICNQLGQQVQAVQADTDQDIDLQKLNSGVYLVKVLQANGAVSFSKLIKE